ncbi:MAG: thioesterase [Oscillospiraceae bacterium]|nr:thioesterase [Oscillospiraceae bacterium]
MINISDKYLQHQQEITITVSDTDFRGQIKPSAIMEYFQNIALAHADILELGYDDMIKKNIVWVMIRMSLKVVQSPRIGEKLTIITVPEKPKAADVDRGYYIYNNVEEIVIVASSKWCMLDTNTYRPQRCTPFFKKFDDSVYIPYQPLEGGNCKINALSNYGNVNEKPFDFTVQVADLDSSIHMNNARYADIILNVCGMEMMQNNNLVRIDINFLNQLFIGDQCKVFKVQNHNFTFMEAKKAKSDTIIFRACAEWQKR